MTACLRITAFTILWLVVIDIAVNVVFRYPSVASKRRPNAFQGYFEYGRSVEGKLARMVGPTKETSSKLVSCGWLTPETYAEQPPRAVEAGGLLVALYGSSFVYMAGEQLPVLDPTITVRLVSAPGAPVGQSYAAYLMDRDWQEAEVVVLGILASLVRSIPTMTYMTWGFDGALPYTYPRFSCHGDVLEEIWPVIRDEAGLREGLQDPVMWSAFLAQLKEHDAFYSPVLFRGRWADASACVRLVRRAWAKHCEKSFEHGIMDGSGFVQDSEPVVTLNAIIASFAASARSDGRLPIVLLVHDFGYGDYLYRAVEKTVQLYSIVTVSTHWICSAADPTNYDPADGGHFTKEANSLVAKSILDTINEQLVQKQTALADSNTLPVARTQPQPKRLP